MTDVWTKKGWPRPIIGGWPIPWVSPANELKRTHPKRMKKVVKHAWCQVCGLGHESKDSKVYLFVNGELQPEPEDMSDKMVQMMDNACLHEHCMKLAAGRCPQLKQMRADGTLWLYSTTWKHVKIYEDSEDGDFLGVAGDHVQRERWPEDANA